MKKLFIIGAGRNGSKLTGKIIGTSIDLKYRHGEIHHGLDPIFFKNGYMGSMSKEQVVKKFKSSRDEPIKKYSEFYVEKNHLIVPILNQVLAAYPDAMFLYVRRNSKDIIRSLYTRNVYSGLKNKYEDGRLSPNKEDGYYTEWGKFGKFEKVCWYVYTMTKMCEKFLNKLPQDQYKVVAYEDFVKDPSVFKDVFKWLGVRFDLEKIKGVLDIQIGSSARSPKEVGYKIVKPGHFKNAQHWKDWSDKKKAIYRRFFGEW